MVRWDHIRNSLADEVFTVIIGHFHEALQVNEEVIHIEGYGFADMDAVIGGFLKAFFRHELFFIELFAGAKACILDFDIHIRFQSGETDKVTSQGVDFNRRAHIQNEYFSAFGIGTCLEDERDSLRHGHEVADDVRVGHGDGTAFSDLLFEEGHDGAVGTEDVTETDSNKLCRRLFF